MRAISYILTTQTVEDRTAALQTTIFNETSSPVCSEVMLPAIDIFHKSFLNLYGICLRKMNKIGLGVSEIIAYFCICKVTVTVCAPANHFTSSLPYELLANTSLSNLRFFSKNLIFRRSDGTVLYE